MKCTNHPKINAVGQCTKCGSFLCEACVATEDKGPLLCEGCLMLSTLTAMTKKKIAAGERKIQKKTVDQEKKQKRRRTGLLIAAAVAILIAVIEVAWYFSIAPEQTDEFVPSDNILVTSTMINDAISKYRDEHGGIVPDSLDDLAGDYLPENLNWSNIFRQFSYMKTAPDKYELVLPETGSEDMPPLIFSDEGVKILGME